MLVSPISNYNQNFTALRLKPGADRYLTSMPKKALNYVDSVGEYIKNTKYYNIDISREVSITHANGDKLYFPLNLLKSGTCLIVRAKEGYRQISKRVKFDSEMKAEAAYEFIGKSETPLVRAGRIVKYLDDYEVMLAEKKAPKEVIDKSDTHDVIVEKLLKKYGV